MPHKHCNLSIFKMNMSYSNIFILFIVIYIRFPSWPSQKSVHHNYWNSFPFPLPFTIIVFYYLNIITIPRKCPHFFMINAMFLSQCTVFLRLDSYHTFLTCVTDSHFTLTKQLKLTHSSINLLSLLIAQPPSVSSC